MAIKSQNELWVDDLVVFVVISHAVVILLILQLVYFTRERNHTQVFLILLDKNLSTLAIYNISVLLIWFGLSSILAVFVPAGMVILLLASFLGVRHAIHLLKIEILYERLHFHYNICLAYHILPVLLPLSALIGALLDHCLCVVFFWIMGHIFLIEVDTPVLEYSHKFRDACVMNIGLSLPIFCDFGLDRRREI